MLDGIDLDIMPGTSMVVIGGSGSGKSVLLKCILGLLEPDAGTIEIDGTDILTLPRHEQEAVRSRIGMLFQNGALFDSLPVWENVVFGLLAQRRLRRSEGPSRAADFLAQVGLAASVGELYPAELSGGMQKRVALARAIAAQPDIMFFDEPTTGLDPIMGAVIDDLVVDCVKQLGSTAVAITHDMASARRIGDAAAMIHRGRIVWSGPASDLMDSGNPIGRPVHPWPPRGTNPDGTSPLDSVDHNADNPPSRRILSSTGRSRVEVTDAARALSPGSLRSRCDRCDVALALAGSRRPPKVQREAGGRAVHAELRAVRRRQGRAARLGEEDRPQGTAGQRAGSVPLRPAGHRVRCLQQGRQVRAGVRGWRLLLGGRRNGQRARRHQPTSSRT